MIRKFKEEDTVKVMTIWTKGNFKEHYFIEKDYWLENFNRFKNECLLNSETYVYIENEEIKGFISMIETNCICAIFVKEDEQRNGIGRKLINHVKEKREELQLHVYEKNVNAMLFFVNMGFKNCGIGVNDKTRRKRIFYEMEKIRNKLHYFIKKESYKILIFNICMTFRVW